MLQEVAPGQVALYSSDQAVHAQYEKPEIRERLAEMFGNEMLSETGGVNRAALRKIVFNNDAARRKLEDLLHPLAFEQLLTQQKCLQQDGKTQLLIAEIPLFYETAREFPADLVIVVAVSPALQQQRMMEKRGLTSVEAARILDAQLPLTRKLELAGKVVWNEGGLPLLRRQAQLLLDQVISQHAN